MNPTSIGRGALLLLLSGLVGCASDSPSTVRVQSAVDHFQARETAQAWIGTLQGQGISYFFTSSILPASASIVHSSGRLWVARGAVQVTFVDREGRTQKVRATPGAPGEWMLDIRTRKNDKENGFSLMFEPLEGQPLRADGVVLELIWSPG